MAKKKAPKLSAVAVALLSAISAAVEDGLLTTDQLVAELGLEAPEAEEKPAKGKGKKAAKEEAPAKGKAAKGKGKKVVEEEDDEDEDEDEDDEDGEEFDRDEAIARLVEEGDHKKAKLKKMDDEELQALLEELDDSDDDEDEDEDDSDDDEDEDEDDEDSDDDEDDEDW